MELTVKDIQKEITVFQERVSAAQARLINLSEGRLPFQEHQKREKVRRDLVADIHHTKTLIKIANEGMQIIKGV